MNFKAILSSVYTRIFVSLILIGYLIYIQDFSAVADNLADFNYLFLGIAFLFLVLGTFLSSFRWKTILSAAGHERPTRYMFALYMKGYFYNNFLPTQLGGDAYKSVALGSNIKDQSLSLFTVFMDRFSGLIALMILALFGLAFLFGYAYVIVAILLLVVGLLLYFPVLKFLGKKIKFFKKFYDASELLIKDRKKGLMILTLSFVIQFVSFALNYCLFLGLGINLPIWSVFAFLPLTSLAILIPSFNGLGTQDLVYSQLFSGANVNSDVSLSVSILLHILRFIMSLIGGVLILFGIGDYKVEESEAV